MMNMIKSPAGGGVINIMVGPVGSGKSTEVLAALGQYSDLIRISKDEIRRGLRGNRQDMNIEPLVSSVYDSTIEKALMRGFNVVLDTTNAHYSTLKKRLAYYKTLGIVNLIFMPNHPLDTLFSRNGYRPQDERLPNEVVKSMWTKYQTTFAKQDELIAEASARVPQEQVNYDDTLPDCVLIDFDDTISGKCDRGPFEWAKVGGDYPLKEMITLLNSLDSSVERIFVTGRSEACSKESAKWIDNHFVFNSARATPLLLMRGKNDFRPAVEVKQDLYEEHIKNKYNVLAVFDDDSRVIEMFRAKGINTLLTKNTKSDK